MCLGLGLLGLGILGLGLGLGLLGLGLRPPKAKLDENTTRVKLSAGSIFAGGPRGMFCFRRHLQNGPV